MKASLFVSILILGVSLSSLHAENDIDGKTVTYDPEKVKDGDPIERDKCNRNEQNSINKENIVRKKLDCNERPNDYFTTEDY